ncbi:MAG TPA: ATPase domain-containing protein, partial [Nitrososphaerales archaeon]|nr:ATPase domain-containing protein [Nitrososphaerales archaeon]
MTSTGEPSLDNLLGGGYPVKSAVLISGGAGSGKEILGYRFIQSGLQLRDFCLYVTCRSVREVLEDVKGSGYEFQNGLPFWISPEGGQVKYEPSDLIKLSFRIKEILKKNSERKIRIVVDICSPLLILHSPNTIYKFLDQLFVEVKQYDAVLLATIEEGMHPQSDLAAMQQLFDGVIVFSLTGNGENQIHVKKMRGIKFQSVATTQAIPFEHENVELEERRTSLDRHRIAILPFTNISPDPNDEYFADGITEELISTISKIRELKVIARTSVIRYKDQKKSANEIGNELKVGCLLEGSVRKAGEKLRITVQLIDSQTSDHLWSESYDRELKDVFAIQTDVAQRVAGALQVQLLNDVLKRIEKKPTNNQEAHSLYLKGLQQEYEFSEGGFEKAL